MTTLEIYAAALLMGSIVLVFCHICLTKPAHLLEFELELEFNHRSPNF